MTAHDKALEAALVAYEAEIPRLYASGVHTQMDLSEVRKAGLKVAITAYHAALEGRGESGIAEIIELALNECIGRSKVTPSILTGRGRKEIAEIAASSLRSALAKCREETVAECAKVLDSQANICSHPDTEKLFRLLAARVRALASTGEKR